MLYINLLPDFTYFSGQVEADKRQAHGLQQDVCTQDEIEGHTGGVGETDSSLDYPAGVEKIL